jgi:hypothetical protein
MVSGAYKSTKPCPPPSFLTFSHEGGNAFVGDAKDFKEVDPKGLGLAVFVAGVGPGFAEKQCPGFDFVPVKTHLVLTK